jgi:hypothetical protein
MVLLRDHFGLAVLVGAVAFVVVLVAFEKRFYPEDAGALSGFLRRRAL